MEIRAIDYSIDDEYDSCGNTAVAVLTHDGIKMTLCDECLSELIRSVDCFTDIVFCRDCINFVMSRHGSRYGGSCKVKAEADNETITEANAGYDFVVDSMHTCDKGIRFKENPYKITIVKAEYTNKFDENGYSHLVCTFNDGSVKKFAFYKGNPMPKPYYVIGETWESLVGICKGLFRMAIRDFVHYCEPSDSEIKEEN